VSALIQTDFRLGDNSKAKEVRNWSVVLHPGQKSLLFLTFVQVFCRVLFQGN